MRAEGQRVASRLIQKLGATVKREMHGEVGRRDAILFHSRHGFDKSGVFIADLQCGEGRSKEMAAHFRKERINF